LYRAGIKIPLKLQKTDVNGRNYSKIGAFSEFGILKKPRGCSKTGSEQLSLSFSSAEGAEFLTKPLYRIIVLICSSARR
jgi:hypothetical protein